MTGKQRAYLRGLANTEQALYQIGKGGISENFVEQIISGLEARELIKIHVLDNCDENVRELCGQLVEKTRAEPVQVIGRKIVLYKESKDNKKIVLPK